ncbi:MAG: LPS export ABC transporter periplasmic protein LptC [Gammaproteobacteria bacterium]
MISLKSFPRPYFTIGLLSVGIVGWYISGQVTQEKPRQEESAPHVPAYFVRNLYATSMGPDGLPIRKLETRYVVQWLDDETTEMETPRYYFHRQDGPPWYVTSEQGWLSADGEQALLSGRVTALRPAGENNPPFKMITRDLRIQPKNNYMETDHPVFAKSREDTIDAVGMQAWMNEPGRIKFLSDVRAHYVPR